MKEFEFEIEENIETDSYYILSYDRKVKITFEKIINNFYCMTYEEEWNTDFWLSIPENIGFQVLSEYLNYNKIYLKNYFKKHFECKKINGEFCFPKNQINKLIEWFESFKIMNRLTE